MKCRNECGRTVAVEGAYCRSCWTWVNFVRHAKRDIEAYWAACRTARRKE
jgi:hypothetical protein